MGTTVDKVDAWRVAVPDVAAVAILVAEPVSVTKLPVDVLLPVALELELACALASASRLAEAELINAAADAVFVGLTLDSALRRVACDVAAPYVKVCVEEALVTGDSMWKYGV